MKTFFRILYNAWMKFAGVLGRIQTFILLFIIYFLGIGFMAVISFIFMRDLLGKNLKDKGTTFWHPREARKADMENSKRQF